MFCYEYFVSFSKCASLPRKRSRVRVSSLAPQIDINLNPNRGLFYLNKINQHLDFANSKPVLLVYY